MIRDADNQNPAPTEPKSVKKRRGRPPKVNGRNADTREQLLRSGLEMLTEKGYAATGIDEILRRVGVPKGSFYHYFKSKEAYGLELLASYERFFNRKLDSFLLNADVEPLQRLENFGHDACTGILRYEFRRGCLVGNLGQELEALPISMREPLRQVFSAWEIRVQRCLDDAQRQGQLSANLDTAEAAYVFWLGWEGAIIRARLERSLAPMQTFMAFFLRSLKR